MSSGTHSFKAPMTVWARIEDGPLGAIGGTGVMAWCYHMISETCTEAQAQEAACALELFDERVDDVPLADERWPETTGYWAWEGVLTVVAHYGDRGERPWHHAEWDGKWIQPDADTLARIKYEEENA